MRHAQIRCSHRLKNSSIAFCSWRRCFAQERRLHFVRQAWRIVEPQTHYVHNWHIDLICTFVAWKRSHGWFGETRPLPASAHPYRAVLADRKPGASCAGFASAALSYGVRRGR